MVERKTCYYLSIKISGKNTNAVMEAMNILKETCGSQFSQVFKAITSDNDSESSSLGLLVEEPLIDAKVHFTYPYTSRERDTNEKHNGMLMRFIPKGKSINSFSSDDILAVSDWCNGLTRKILGYHTPEELFDQEMDAIYAA